ncbi:MAG: GNAT family N-acetyltransferase [Burkholderiales bacterium]|nr:GNAT family N-acetyltransferase [Burkholderiales bacterium]
MLAGMADIPEIVKLLCANTRSNGGSLSGEWSRPALETWFATGGRIAAARIDGELAGVLLASERDAPQVQPVRAALDSYRGGDDAYVYGPICVGADFRGRNVAAALLVEVRKHYGTREAVLFIRADNIASRRAHAKLGMFEMATYTFADEPHIVLSDRPDHKTALCG